MTTETFTLTINNQTKTITTHPQQPLLETLREECSLTGAKYGCGEGQCGACTVLADGQPIHACTTTVKDVAKKSLLTIEGLGTPEKLHPVQQAFLEENAFQCGYCTTGMIMATVALLAEIPHPTDEQIREKLNGHICRCCGYVRQIQAVHRAAGDAREAAK